MNALPEPIPGRLLVLLAPHAAREVMLDLTARLALRGPLRVMDAGNRFNVYIVARLLRRLGRERQGGMLQALGRIQMARAFTCYQVATLLEQAPESAEPVLVIDLLNTFYDQSVPLPERRRLLEGCLEHLHRLSERAPVIASLRPPRPPQSDPNGLVQMVQSAADVVWFPEAHDPEPPLKLL